MRRRRRSAQEGYFIKGADPIRDLRICLPGWTPEVVFDVGANVGQSAAGYLEAFPGATIHCFEPVAATFEELRERFAGVQRVICARCALGATSRAATIAVGGGSTQSSLVAESPHVGELREPVQVRTLDDVCQERTIAHIDLLKIDTEGFDLEVLRGAHRMLEDQAISLVEVEAGMNPENPVHVPFEKLKAHLEAAGYRLFGIYEQKEEWPTLEPHLRRTNLLFISRPTIDRFQGHAPGSPP